MVEKNLVSELTQLESSQRLTVNLTIPPQLRFDFLSEGSTNLGCEPPASPAVDYISALSSLTRTSFHTHICNTFIVKPGTGSLHTCPVVYIEDLRSFTFLTIHLYAAVCS